MIFDHAIRNSSDYDEAIKSKLAEGKSGETRVLSRRLARSSRSVTKTPKGNMSDRLGRHRTDPRECGVEVWGGVIFLPHLTAVCTDRATRGMRRYSALSNLSCRTQMCFSRSRSRRRRPTFSGIRGTVSGIRSSSLRSNRSLPGWTARGAQFLSLSSLCPWNRPQSTNTLVAPSWSRNFEPVTVWVAPRNVSRMSLPFRDAKEAGLSPKRSGLCRARCLRTRLHVVSWMGGDGQ